jgi:hypothetical protein
MRRFVLPAWQLAMAASSALQGHMLAVRCDFGEGDRKASTEGQQSLKNTQENNNLW